MKRLCILFLILSLYLLSCSRTDEIDTKVYENAANANAPYTFMIDGDLPDIGEFSGHDSAGRFYDEPTYEFIPSDAYGRIVPFIAEIKDFDVLKKYSYGFCTPDGRIVMDASFDNEYVGYSKTDDGFEYYTVSKKNDNAVDEFEPTRSLFIPASGKWYLDFEPYTYSTFVGDGIIVVSKNDQSYDNTEYFFYDYNGNEILHLTGYDFIGGFSNGMFYAAVYDEDLYYCLNMNGERVLGPFARAVEFNKDGVAPVMINSDSGYCLMDISGKTLTESVYRNCRTYTSDDGKREIFLMEHQSHKNKKHIYDSNGNFLGEIISSAYISFKFPDNGDIYYYYALEYPNMVWKKLSDHSDFVSNDSGLAPNSYISKDNAYVHLDAENHIGYVFDGNGDTIAVVDDYYGESIEISDSGRYISYTNGEYNYNFDEITGEAEIYDSRQFNLYDTETDELLYTFDMYGFAKFIDEDERYLIINCYEEIDFFSTRPTAILYDTVNRCAVFENCKDILHYSVAEKDYFIVCTDNSCILYDEEFNSVRKYYYE